jgi:aminoglycoside phosphotransferase (APT) family kinase protein
VLRGCESLHGLIGKEFEGVAGELHLEMATTPRAVIDSVVRSICGREVERLVRLTGGGLHETYRAEIRNGVPVVVRIARRPVPWFTEEERVMARARDVGVPTPEVVGVEQVDHGGELLSFSIQRFLPGRSLDELAGVLSASDVERLVMDGGELLARVHSVVPDRGIRHELEPPDESFVAHVVRVTHQALGPAAASVVERGADFLRDEVVARPAPELTLAHADWLPKHLLVHGGEIVGVIDWEFAGPASPAYDLARWEVSADALHDRSEMLRCGYARVADPDAAAAGWLPAFAVDWALEVLGWRNPARPEQLRRCVDVIARYAGS